MRVIYFLGLFTKHNALCIRVHNECHIYILTLSRWSFTVQTRDAKSLDAATIWVPVLSNSTDITPALLPMSIPLHSAIPVVRKYSQTILNCDDNTTEGHTFRYIPQLHFTIFAACRYHSIHWTPFHSADHAVMSILHNIVAKPVQLNIN